MRYVCGGVQWAGFLIARDCDRVRHLLPANQSKPKPHTRTKATAGQEKLKTGVTRTRDPLWSGYGGPECRGTWSGGLSYLLRCPGQYPLLHLGPGCGQWPGGLQQRLCVPPENRPAATSAWMFGSRSARSAAWCIRVPVTQRDPAQQAGSSHTNAVSRTACSVAGSPWIGMDRGNTR